MLVHLVAHTHTRTRRANRQNAECIVGGKQLLCNPIWGIWGSKAHGHPFFPDAPFSCAVIHADSLWRAFELTSKEKKEILWVPVFSCPPHSPYTHTHQFTHTHLSHILTLCCHFIQESMCAPVHPQTVRTGKTHHLYPSLCLTRRVDWTINASMDLGKAFGETGGSFLSSHLLQCVILGQGLRLRLHSPAVVQSIMTKAEREKHTSARTQWQ